MSQLTNERVAWFNGEFMPEREVRIPFREFELGLWRRLLRHDPHLRPPAVQGEGACRPALPLAQISAHRSGLRAAEDVRPDRGGVRAQPPPARVRRRLLGRPAHQPRREGSRRATTSITTAPTSCSNAMPLPFAQRAKLFKTGIKRRHPVAPPHPAGFAHAARQDAQLSQPDRRRSGGSEHRPRGVGGAARRQRQSLRGARLEHSSRRSIPPAERLRQACAIAPKRLTARSTSTTQSRGCICRRSRGVCDGRSHAGR